MYKPQKGNSTRVEFRSVDAACDPYLAFAVILAAGLKGIEGDYELPPGAEDDVWALTSASNKVDTTITAAMPASRAAATILLRLLDTVDANVGGVLADTDTEFLHDLRVSVRRTRSALKLFGDVLLTAADGSAGRADRGGARVLRRRVQMGRRPDHADQGPGRAPARLRRHGARARRGQAGRPGAVPRVPGAAAAQGVPRPHPRPEVGQVHRAAQ